MGRASQTVSLEIEAELSAKVTQEDYGVDRSPVWNEYSDEEIEDGITIGGKEYSPEQLKGMTAWDLLSGALIEAAEPENWEGGDDDPPDYDDD